MDGMVTRNFYVVKKTFEQAMSAVDGASIEDSRTCTRGSKGTGSRQPSAQGKCRRHSMPRRRA
jgi:hypothetical protein